MQDLGRSPEAASNTPSCQQETLHSKQLGSIKVPIDSTHGIYRGENPAPGKDVHGELDRTPGIRDGQDPNRALTSGSAHIGSFHSYG